ncbi:MAG: hypothetical protein IJF07_08585 [Lachnospiraceae bacterium]|nr:hypothetical protein [Lachnospiraceae bacterium]
MDAKSKRLYKSILYVVIFLIVSLPVFYGSMMEGGRIRQWISCIEELSAALLDGTVLWFPSIDVIFNTSAQLSLFRSNVWNLFPAIVYMLFQNITFTYQVMMILLQLGTLMAAILLFGRIFEEERAAFFGVLLYMTCPYRIYLCYDKADMAQAVVWMLFPIYIWAVYELCTAAKKLKGMTVAALVLAGIGYADVTLLLVICGVTVLLVLFTRRWQPLVPLVAGCIMVAPVLLRLAKYLFKGEYAELGIPLDGIMEKGYAGAQFFTSYAYLEGQPGMGLALMIGLATLGWLYFAVGNIKLPKQCGVAAGISAILILMSYRLFPWDIFQRLGGWSIRLIPLLETPGVFFGIAHLGLCILAAFAVERVSKQENKMLAIGLPACVLAAALGVAAYLCNTLTYYRMPLA